MICNAIKDKGGNVLLDIARFSPKALNLNSRYLCSLRDVAGLIGKCGHSSFFHAISHGWKINLCSNMFSILANAAPELK